MLLQLRYALFPAALVLFAILGPFVLEPFDLVNLSAFSAMAIAALGLAFVWGTLGILNLGHSVFFGLGAYAYAMSVSNVGDSTIAVLIGTVLPVVFSLVLGYFLFFSRLGEVYLGVITLCVTLIFYSFMTSTADPWFHIGPVPLGGFNGITAVPSLNIPGEVQGFLSIEATFSICLVSLAGIYILLSFLRMSDAGRIMTAIRESELRSELLGYDIRLYKLVGFAISAAIAGLGGALYTAVMGFVSPNVFDLSQASQFVLWVIAGGLGTFVGPVVASFGFQLLSSQLGANTVFNTELIFGATIILFVLLAPQGLLPMILKLSNLRFPNGFGRLRRKEKPA
ncbi:branched-chain amino acid ABC transporter permease [Bradyrhizobium sp. CIAT3101]|uniref:branched-chain amino acid ABC transporter permease n=1 Tax=Bradyrhizobium sp. CIAT3101 TaxID=439387 RepID=UPI0024B0DBE9|nr:branched-chain amino acid ABC transporter permease [Bradyrhizobium sp. CIAT3101]WFU80370.1 branched-chain amino acid ABC transporter permease [Bradyrhizobium sp. CIAT3101]